MTTYHCSECGAPATVEDGEVIRTCEHEAPVIADIQAVASGESAVN
jgi:uncharacterized Zn finger protein (UPF0148 family)